VVVSYRPVDVGHGQCNCTNLDAGIKGIRHIRHLPSCALIALKITQWYALSPIYQGQNRPDWSDQAW
jgi:hypothetical protein